MASTPLLSPFRQKVADYKAFVKLRLSLLVVFSAGIGYVVACRGDLQWMAFCMLLLGGFLITASANGLNQIIERQSDQLMERTASRPMATGRMGMTEGLLVSLLTGIAGVVLIWTFTYALSALLGLLSLLLYAFVYTPMKRISPLSVLVGAFPGALPVLIGYSAYGGALNFEAGYLFLMQFIWQFPHFWAIAWVLHEDYARAGIAMLPSRAPGHYAASQIVLYTLSLIPIGLVPWITHYVPLWGAGVLVAVAAWFSWKALRHFRVQDRKSALGVMFASIIYLPIAQVGYAVAVLAY